jgi:hypothetical protein
MISRNLATAIGLSLLCFLGGCSSKNSTTDNAGEDRGSQLTRLTALTVLRRNISNLGWHPETCRVPLRLNATMYKTASPQELQGVLARLAQQHTFYQGLANAGVVKDELFKTSEGEGSVQTYQNYYYSLVPQPDISVEEDDRAKWAVFVLDKLSIDEVTGISQEGSSAQIVAKVSYPFTAAANTLSKLRGKYDDQWGVTDCYTVMQKLSQTPTETQNFQARKFDDGWRIQ